MSETPTTDKASDIVALLKDAQAIVFQSPNWRHFIDGTPLSNDIAVMMVEFARDTLEPLREMERTLRHELQQARHEADSAKGDADAERERRRRQSEELARLQPGVQ